MVVNKIHRDLDLQHYNYSDRDEILKSVISYFLGLIEYSDSVTVMKEFDVHKRFLHLLKSMELDHIDFVLMGWRGFCKHGDDVKLKYPSIERDIDSTDRKTLTKFSTSIPYDKVKLRDYPKLNLILNNMTANIHAKSVGFMGSVQEDRALEVSDFISELKMKAVETYKQYIFSYTGEDQFDFNEKMLYKCINRSLVSRGIDILKRSNKRACVQCHWDERRVLDLEGYGISIE